MNPMTRKKFIKTAYKYFFEKCEAIFFLYEDDESFEMIHGNDIFIENVGERGSCVEFYQSLFFKNKDGELPVEQGFQAFMDVNLFKQENYHGCMSIKEKNYEYRILKVEDGIHIIYFIEDTDVMNEERITKMKFDTLQEDYLYSMVVDLKANICKDAQVTELSSEKQGYTDLAYTSWRNIIVEMFREEDREMFLKLTEPQNVLERLLSEGKFHADYQMRAIDGIWRWVRLHFSSLRGFSRENQVFVFSVKDISEEMEQFLKQEQMVTDVKEQNEQLSGANAAKTLMFSKMSHEFRTPINAVLGLNEMIIRESTDETIRSYAQDIKNAGQTLLQVVNDILDFSKLETGKLDIVPVQYNVREMVESVRKLIDYRAKEKNLIFTIQVAPNVPSELIGDDVRIRQILTNLLANAVKYTSAGSVRLMLAYTAESDWHGSLRVIVKDTGIGIRPEDIDALCIPFQRIEEQRNHHIEGTGLGMSIVNSLLEQMGSRLEVASVYGQGSQFSFSLEQDAIPESAVIHRLAKKKQKLQFFSGARILVVDDNKTNAFVLKSLLKATTTAVDTVTGGMECLALLEKNKYDLIFLDHLMPQMDGIETLNRIKSSNLTDETTPIIALTANVTAGARDIYLGYGFTDYLEKPIDPDRLMGVLLQYLDLSEKTS
ncbi:MAG: response regulator [bacterium]|nr:response regulator [bacterium]